MKKATSTWILRNSKHIGEILDSWDSQLVKSDHEHRLTLLYLANDVVQNCRKKHPDLLGTYQDCIGRFFSYSMIPYDSYGMNHTD